MLNWFKKKPKFQWSNWELHDTKDFKNPFGNIERKWEIYKRTREDGVVEYSF